MSQQILSHIREILSRIDHLEQANEALAARIMELETWRAAANRPLTIEDGPNGPVLKRGPGRPPNAAAGDGTQRI